MISNELQIEISLGFLCILIGVYILDNVFLGILLSLICCLFLMLYFSEDERMTIQNKGHGIDFPIFETEFLPNSILQDINQEVFVFTGFLFLSTIDEDISVATIRLQSQFNIFHRYSQLGATFIFFSNFEITPAWSNLPEFKQKYILQQSKQHLENFQGVLQEIIPGMKHRFLTIKELKKELAFGPSHQILLDFDYSPDHENTSKNVKRDENSYLAQDLQNPPEIATNIASK